MFGFIWIFLLLVALVLGGIAYSMIAARRRREAMAEVALSLGLLYERGQDYSLDERYPFLDKLVQGSNRYAYNIISGTYRGHYVQVFDYHYETKSTDSKGKTQTHHHHFSFFILRYDQSFPELIIAREGWASKVAQFFGFDDIDFESAEFSSKFVVRSPDKKFAYDICHPQMIEYLLTNRDLTIEIEDHCLTLFFPKPLEPSEIIPNLHRLIEVRDMFPDYLMASPR